MASPSPQTAQIEVKHSRQFIRFGVFELVTRKARRARNPRTGERIDVLAKTVVRFKPAWALQERAEAIPLPPGV